MSSPNENSTTVVQPPKINVQLGLFSGSDKVDWFLNQLREYKTINNLDNNSALFLLKSRLTGAALEYFSNSPECLAVDNFEEACELLARFFQTQSSPSIELNEFRSITLGHGESVQNLAFRISVSCQKAYKFINDRQAIQQIKALQLQQALPIAIREKLLLEDQSNFDQLVAKAQQIQLLQQSLQCPNLNAHAHEFVPQKINDPIADLQKQVEQLTLAITKNQSLCRLCSKSQHPIEDCEVYRSLKSVPHAQSSNSPLTCHYCGGRSHVMADCHRFKAVNRNNHSQNYHRGSRIQNPPRYNQQFYHQSPRGFNPRPQHRSQFPRQASQPQSFPSREFYGHRPANPNQRDLN